MGDLQKSVQLSISAFMAERANMKVDAISVVTMVDKLKFLIFYDYCI